MNRPVTPENVLSNDDPGDDTQRRFRYQATYAAIISLSLLQEESEFECIFCEHHEDVLVKRKDGTFVGIQIKTRRVSNGPYKAIDEPIVKSLRRFVKLEHQFPEYFSQYAIAVNNGFWHEKKNSSNLSYLLQLAKDANKESIAPQEDLVNFAKNKLSSSKDEDKEIRDLILNDDSTIRDLALKVLSKVELKADLPGLDDIERHLINDIAKLPDINQRGYDELKDLANDLIHEMLRAASLANDSSQPLYFDLLTDSEEKKTAASIQGKCITKEKIRNILYAQKTKEETQPEQTIERHVAAYRKQLIYRLENLQIFKMSSPLKLENIYVKLQVRQEQPLSSTQEEEKGEPGELLRQSQRRLAEKAATAISPEEALTEHKRITVLGEPGAGKTTILRHLAVRMAKDEPSLPYLPIYVELKFLEGNTENVLEFVAADLVECYGFQNARPYLEKQLKDGNAALLLDGLDEVLGGKSPAEAKNAYNQAVDKVNQLATQFLNAPIAVTCRRAGWRGGLTGFQTMEVLEFDGPDIKEFANNWFQSDPSNAEGLWQELNKNLRMKTLAGNPLILSLMAIVYGRELKLPERRSELYKHCVEVLLEEWDAEPNRDVKRFRQFKPTQMQKLLIEVAWYFHQQGTSYFREAELLRQLPRFLSNDQINISPEENQAILEEITDSSSLLKEAAYELYGFLHLTFQEYFAALAANKKGAVGWQEVVKHRHEPWWEEVILLLAECMDDATPLLLGILGRSLPPLLPGNINQLIPEGEPLAVNDDLFDSDLLLAARCLVGKPKVLMQGLRDRIITEVKDLLSNSPYALNWERAAKVLVEIGDPTLIDELLEMLVIVGKNELERRRMNVALMEKQFIIASACGKYGDQNVGNKLLKLFQRKVERDGRVCGRILYSLAELKVTNASDYLLKRFREKNDEWILIRLQIARALIELGETSITSELLTMRTDPECYNREEIEIFELLGSSGDQSIAPKLLDLILADTTSSRVKPAISRALRDLKNASLVNSILQHIQDESLDWQIRWLLTESLEGLQESAIDSLRQIPKNHNVDECVQVGIATTLGIWGEQESITYLVQAIERQVVPPNWCLGDSIWLGYVWQRITRTLKSLGDESVVPTLVQALEQSQASWDHRVAPESGRKFIVDYANRIFTRTEKYNLSICEAKGIIWAASEYQSDTIAQQILSILRQSHWLVFQNEILNNLPTFITKLLVPELRELLPEIHNNNRTSNWKRCIVRAIGEVADDRETVTELRKAYLSLTSNQEMYLKSEIYSALYSVSHRARLRVSRDEQI
ncbi:dsDNA nuclease domain-containing protein [Coleofasciculus chthonoplastes]|uniref:dsDNA nuclease domain-containing protein n=1 Tax=Coleofasciculus chthonoplastes TaxID=64178 RepID=UPI0032F6AED5